MFMTARKKSVRRKIGGILKVDLRDGTHCYGHITVDPCIIFYDGRFDVDVDVSDISKLPELFNLSVSNYAIKDGVWPIIGFSALTEKQLLKPYRYMQDDFTGKLSIYHPDFADTNYQRQATFEECVGLECAAVWDPEHVFDRLIDHYEGRANKWVSQLAINEKRYREFLLK